jgi:hypothetical protein
MIIRFGRASFADETVFAAGLESSSASALHSVAVLCLPDPGYYFSLRASKLAGS